MIDIPSVPIDVDVTPYGKWNNALVAKVQEHNGVNKPFVPIIVVPWTPAKIAIWPIEFPEGVVILNENPRPNNSITESTTTNAEFKGERAQPNPQGYFEVDIIRNVGWPCGKIILW